MYLKNVSRVQEQQAFTSRSLVRALTVKGRAAELQVCVTDTACMHRNFGDVASQCLMLTMYHRRVVKWTEHIMTKSSVLYKD